ncbi:hypothetical protein [Methanoculleus sp.]|uniref:hypothetical protein n=1 Tax=Methanoculleus sp. TaxID=90427 RepID=UPI002FCAFE79
MESKFNRRLIIMGVLAFIGAALLVATVALTCTTLVALITGVDGLPQDLDVREVRGEHLENASIIHLTDQDLEQFPALDSVIRGDNRDPHPWKLEGSPNDDPDERTIGRAPVTGTEHLVLIESFGIDAKNPPYLEYNGAYYYIRTLIH